MPNVTPAIVLDLSRFKATMPEVPASPRAALDMAETFLSGDVEAARAIGEAFAAGDVAPALDTVRGLYAMVREGQAPDVSRTYHGAAHAFLYDFALAVVAGHLAP